jgi:hypothetical protein
VVCAPRDKLVSLFETHADIIVSANVRKWDSLFLQVDFWPALRVRPTLVRTFGRPYQRFCQNL